VGAHQGATREPYVEIGDKALHNVR
jgi:hypothetical protein